MNGILKGASDSSFEEDLILVFDVNTASKFPPGAAGTTLSISGGSGWVDAELCITTEYFTFYI